MTAPDLAEPNLGPLHVRDHRRFAPALTHRRVDPPQEVTMFVVGAVGKVQAERIRPRVEQRDELFRPFRGRTDRCEDLGPPHGGRNPVAA